MKQFILLLFIIAFSVSSAQNFSDRWMGYFSYLNVSDTSDGENEIYVSVENAVFSYNLLTKEIKTVTTIDGLEGEIISSIHFSKAFNKLIIGYTTGLIEIFDPLTRDVLKVVDVINKQTIPPNLKRINHFNEFGNILYVACQFGIVEYKLDRLEFGDTFFIGTGGSLLTVTQTAVLGNQIFAATLEQGIKEADLTDPNLIDSSKWKTARSGSWEAIVPFNNTVYAMSGNQLFRYNISFKTFERIRVFGNNPITAVKANAQAMTITTSKDVFVMSTGEIVVTQISDFQNNRFTFTTAQTDDNVLFVGTSEKGLLKFNLPDITTPDFIAPDGPIRNDSFAIKAAPEEVWVAFGQYTNTFNPFPLDSRGVSHLQNGEWINIPFSALKNARDLSSINISPIDEKVYISSFHDGLLVLENNEVVNLLNDTNSGLESLSPTTPDIRIHDTKFDAEGNLWVTNSRVENGIKVLLNNGQWQSFSVKDVILNPLNDELAFSKLVIGQDGTKWIASASNGLIGFNENNSTNPIRKITDENGNLPIEDVRSLAIDHRNQLWIGTRRGLRVLFDTAGFFTDSNPQAEEIVILENGVPQELLFEQFITDIEIDGSNNKWIATGDAGVFQLSPDGQRTLRRFTQANSPLPTNIIHDISIDEQSGRVYFATQRGLVSFLGKATAPKDNLNEVIVFPNPVKPDFNGNLTIRNLTRRARVKITDISGNLVFETVAQGGTIEWDLRAFGRYKVASGVYMIIITTDDGSKTKVTKVMIIR